MSSPSLAAPPEVDLDVIAEEPVFGPVEGESYTNPGAVVQGDGELLLFRNSFTGHPGPASTHLLSSADQGRTWVVVDEQPLVTTADVPYTELGNVFVRGVVPGPDGGWLAYFYVFEGASSRGVVGMASADQLAGPWTVAPDPVLEPGPSGAWDDRRVSEPAVIRRGHGYHMWFHGSGRDGTDAIGHATSADGVSWTKHDDPATTGERFARSDPVLTGDPGWTDGDIGDPVVVDRGDALWLFYDNADETPRAVGLAVSQDGVAWTPHPDNPLVTPEVIGRPNLWQFGAVGIGPDEVLLLVEARAESGTAVYPVRVTVRSTAD